MTAGKIKEVVEKYKEILRHAVAPVKIADYSSHTHNKVDVLRHCHWMLYEIDGFLAENRIEKSFRWLGFIQGCLFSAGFLSLDDLKNDNKPNTQEQGR